ncbi:cytochrome c [Photobacterium piscicola]|uniref:C-type cytochrome n=1 Tax=Photobacterium piscicola TaxID=1378299 RepID=A0A1T5I4A5_9GAMM|nr:c-type cytochrome [Photobacterium piscicola]MEC6824537.1 c-type cytochrome [Photobacterium piscicola]MEC6883760.1 c-type cytochrome [Photobacterium piscicola]MEC6899931.1 c-type cytochrome [Photobacterium piscicola]SKC33930.1 Cytochrome c4 [Photobacterium piscicola]
MKKLVLIFTLVASYSAWAQGDVDAGKLKATTCVACHGSDGNATIGQYPKLAGQHADYLAKQLADYKLAVTSSGAQGRSNAVMAGMAAALSATDMADLSAYFSSLPLSGNTTPKNVIAIAEPLYRFGDPERGIAACISCHGPRGNGTSLSGFPKISGQNAQYTQLQLQAFRSSARNNDLNAMMRSVAVKLSDDEISALSAYVGGLH